MGAHIINKKNILVENQNVWRTRDKKINLGKTYLSNYKHKITPLSDLTRILCFIYSTIRVTLERLKLGLLKHTFNHPNYPFFIFHANEMRERISVSYILVKKYFYPYVLSDVNKGLPLAICIILV